MYLGISFVEIVSGVFTNIGLALTTFINGIINSILTPLFAALDIVYPPASN